ncbi:hypothetical protein [Vibrio sp. R78045]|uniref:hypothetical protein n=1 Tax=Vibrio sp. R78045 TaxID=3093868 RepID=UPI0036F2346F
MCQCVVNYESKAFVLQTTNNMQTSKCKCDNVTHGKQRVFKRVATLWFDDKSKMISEQEAIHIDHLLLTGNTQYLDDFLSYM